MDWTFYIMMHQVHWCLVTLVVAFEDWLLLEVLPHSCCRQEFWLQNAVVPCCCICCRVLLWKSIAINKQIPSLAQKILPNLMHMNGVVEVSLMEVNSIKFRIQHMTKNLLMNFSQSIYKHTDEHNLAISVLYKIVVKNGIPQSFFWCNGNSFTVTVFCGRATYKWQPGLPYYRTIPPIFNSTGLQHLVLSNSGLLVHLPVDSTEAYDSTGDTG